MYSGNHQRYSDKADGVSTLHGTNQKLRPVFTNWKAIIGLVLKCLSYLGRLPKEVTLELKTKGWVTENRRILIVKKCVPYLEKRFSGPATGLLVAQSWWNWAQSSVIWKQNRRENYSMIYEENYRQ